MAEYHLRRADEPHQVYTHTLADGSVEEFKADADGVIEPKSAAQAAALDTFGLPVARKAERERSDNQDDEPVQETGPDTTEGEA